MAKKNARTNVAATVAADVIENVEAMLEAVASAPVAEVADTEIEAALETDAAVEVVAEAAPEETAPVDFSEPADEAASEETPANDAVSFADMLGAVSAEDVNGMVEEIARQLTEREKHEEVHGSDNIFKTLKRVRSDLVRPAAARVMLALSIDPSFINRSISGDKRYNVYALQKLADLIDALSGLRVSNAINRAVLRTMKNFAEAGVEFTGDLAKAAASDKIRVEPRYRSLMASHTVSAVTAPTQASSTMQALRTLGVVAVSGSQKNPVYRLNNNPQTTALLEAVMK